MNKYDRAVDIFDGFINIVKREMLVHGVYISHNVDPKLAAAGAICQGHKACALGSVALAARLPESLIEDFDWNLILDRSDPGLRLAAKELDKAALAELEGAASGGRGARTASRLLKDFTSGRDAEYYQDHPGRITEAFFEHFLYATNRKSRERLGDGSIPTVEATRQGIIDLVRKARRAVRKQQREANAKAA